VEILKSRGWIMADNFNLYRASGESVEHLFRDCLFDKQLISSMFQRLSISIVGNADTFSWEAILDLSVQKEVREILVIGCFII
jgi:hypothetical protein